MFLQVYTTVQMFWVSEILFIFLKVNTFFSKDALNSARTTAFTYIYLFIIFYFK